MLHRCWTSAIPFPCLRHCYWTSNLRSRPGSDRGTEASPGQSSSRTHTTTTPICPQEMSSIRTRSMTDGSFPGYFSVFSLQFSIVWFEIGNHFSPEAQRFVTDLDLINYSVYQQASFLHRISIFQGTARVPLRNIVHILSTSIAWERFLGEAYFEIFWTIF